NRAGAKPVWLAAVAAAVAGSAVLMAGPGAAAPVVKFKPPRLGHSLLAIQGTPASDKIALRLEAGDPGVIQVDVGDDGSADFSFDRGRVARIVVDARGGDDSVRIDDGNGAFTDAIPTTI